ncbi:MAG: type I-U CRISPR-associated protein Csb2 [Gemmatimonadota bacterium]
MLAVQVELLTGRYVASEYNDRTKAEWPPHPARFYSALVATWAETGSPVEEAAALDFLATLPAPELHVPEIQRERDSSTFYVPVNDTSIVRTYQSNWQKMNAAWQQREEAREGLDRVTDGKERRKLEQSVQRSTKAIDQLRKTVAGFLTGGKVADSGLALLPDQRTKQARHFPSVSPDEPRFVLVWAEAGGMKPHLPALDRLLARVHRLGHSHSLVLIRRVEDPPAANWIPHEDGDTAIRWVSPGQRKALVEYHDLHCGVEPRVMPAVTIAYGRAEELIPEEESPESDLAGDFIIYERAGGPPVPVTRAVSLAETVHRALVKMAEPLPEGGVHPAVCGRDPNGKVTRDPHVLILPLPYVASQYADGTVMGVAFAIPRAVSEDGRIQILRALGQWERHGDAEDRMIKVHLGSRSPIELRRVLGKSDRYNLQPRTWCRASRTWVTATPVALDRNPKTLWARDAHAATQGERRAIRSIRQACERIGLPQPEQVSLERTAPLRGTEPVGSHPPFPGRGAGPRRVLVHAHLRFTELIRGPVVLGAGRFRGAGLFRPIREERRDRSPPEVGTS